MAGGPALEELLAAKGDLVIDGALATELEKRGCDLNDPVWSAKALLEKPELVQQVHEDYFHAGADVAITASYQATPMGLARKGLSHEQAIDLIKTSVILAQQARNEILKTDPTRQMLIAGSVGPFGAYLADGSEYTGSYNTGPHNVHRVVMEDFHRPRIQALVDAGVDCLACETMPTWLEIKYLTLLLQNEFPNSQAWFSFTIRDVLHIADGTAMSKVLTLFEDSPNVVAVGVNCVAQHKVTGALKHMSSLTSLPLIAYPNSGEQWDAVLKEWYGDSTESEGLALLVKEWRASGARMIGGCCRTGPESIKAIRASIER